MGPALFDYNKRLVSYIKQTPQFLKKHLIPAMDFNIDTNMKRTMIFSFISVLIILGLITMIAGKDRINVTTAMRLS